MVRVDELMVTQLQAQEGTQKRCRKTQLITFTGPRDRVTSGCKGSRGKVGGGDGEVDSIKTQ